MALSHGIDPNGIVDGTTMVKIAYFLALSSLIIAGCHLLPRAPPGRLTAACLFLVIGFIATQGMLSGTISALGLVPRGPLHELVEYLTDYDDNRPVVLLVGSSFTQQGVDLDLLAETLGNYDRSIAVLPLGGLSVGCSARMSPVRQHALFSLAKS